MPENPNAISNFATSTTATTFDYHGWHARLQAVNEAVLRFTVTKEADWPSAPSQMQDVTVNRTTDNTIATGGSGQAVEVPIILTDSTMPITWQGEAGHFGNLSVCFNRERNQLIVQAPHVTLTQSLPQLQETGWQTTIRTNSGNHYFGGGMQNGKVNLDGQLVQIANENRWTKGGVTSPVPFYWSSAGYGLVVNSFTKGTYDFSNPKFGAWLEHEDPVYDAYLILAETPAEILQRYHQLTGAAAMLPRFSLYPGHFNAYNRDYWVPVTADSAGAVRFEDGQYYKEYQPISEKTFNTGYRPGTITVNGLTLVPNVNGSGQVTFTDVDAAGNPKTAYHENLNGESNPQFSARAVLDRYRQAQMPLGWFLPNDGYGAGYGQSASFAGDLANLANFSQYAKAHGVQTGLWTQETLQPKDPKQPQKGERDLEQEITTGGITALKTDVAWVGEGYTFGLNATTKAAAIMAKHQLRPMIVSVDGWAGSQRNAMIWSGDQSGSDWTNVKTHISSYLSAGLSGLPHVASDIDGIYGGLDPVIQTRDLQWKSFTAHFFAMDGWGDVPKQLGVERAPEFLAINRAFMQYHVQLVPYLYTLMHQAHQSGTPLVRPTFWQQATDYTLSDALESQFMLGDAFLVAPVVDSYGLQKDGSGKRAHAFLPAGQWYHFWDDQVLEGERTLSDLTVPLTQLPVWVRAGSLVPLAPVHLTPGEYASEHLLLDYYPSQTASELTLYSDAGQGLTDTSVTTTIHAQAGEAGVTLTLDAPEGDHQEQATSSWTVFVVGQSPSTVSVTTAAGNTVTPKWQVGQRQADALAAYRNQSGVSVELPTELVAQAPLTITIRN